MEIEYRFENVIFDLYELHCLIDARLAFPGEDRDDVARKADVPVDEKAVERAWLGRGLSRLRVAPGILRDILPREHRLHAGNEHGAGNVDLADDGVGVRRAEELHDETVFRRDVLGVDRLSGHELHGVELADGLADGVHAFASFAFFHARKRCIPRSCPS